MSNRTKIWYLQNFNLLASLNNDAMMELDQKTKMKENAKKEIIYFPEESSNTIYFLKEGKIKISRISKDGKITAFDLLGPGEIFGESALLGQESHENIAEVVENSIICSINNDIFQDILEKNPQLNKSINKFIGFRLRKIQAHVEDLVFKSARERVESFLKRYVRDFGKEMVDGRRVKPFLTHQEIAELTANTRQTVNTILNELVASEKIKYSRRYFHVLDEKWFNN